MATSTLLSFKAFSFMASIGFGGGISFLLSCCVGQGSFAACKCGYAHGYLICSFCTCSFVFNFHFTHVISPTKDIMRGVLVAIMPKKQNDPKKNKGGKEKESLQNGCLRVNETGKKETGSQILLPHKMIPQKIPKMLSETTTS